MLGVWHAVWPVSSRPGRASPASRAGEASLLLLGLSGSPIFGHSRTGPAGCADWWAGVSVRAIVGRYKDANDGDLDHRRSPRQREDTLL